MVKCSAGRSRWQRSRAAVHQGGQLAGAGCRREGSASLCARQAGSGPIRPRLLAWWPCARDGAVTAVRRRVTATATAAVKRLLTRPGWREPASRAAATAGADGARLRTATRPDWASSCLATAAGNRLRHGACLVAPHGPRKVQGHLVISTPKRAPLATLTHWLLPFCS
jgi:hypothetical protein